MMASERSPVIVFDWDWSAVNENTDTFVPTQLAPDLLRYISLKHSVVPWTALMADIAAQMFVRGITHAQIRDALCRLPCDDDMLSCFSLAAEQRVPLHIVSDANTVYIRTILEHRGLTCDSVTTNTAYFDDAGQLIIAPHQPKESPHGCPRCPINLCKGGVLDAKGLGRGGINSTRTFYVGDGSGDACACLRLGDGDVICARKGYPLLKILNAHHDPPLLARVVAWESGRDVRAALLDFLRK